VGVAQPGEDLGLLLEAAQLLPAGEAARQGFKTDEIQRTIAVDDEGGL